MLRAAAAIAFTLLLAAPGQALASSIAFIKDNNVWLISPDGSRQRQLTSDGSASKGYAFPSQADDGTILAKLGNSFVRLRPGTGSKIGDPIPAIGSDTTHSGNVFVMAGPAAPKISPDGTRFAYWISARSLVTCPPWYPGCSYDDTDYTIVSRVDRFTAPEEFKAVRDYRDPSWVGNDRLLVFNHGLAVKEAALSTVGAGEPGLQQWFDPPTQIPQLSAGEMTRQGDKLAALAGADAMGLSEEYVFLYGVAAGYPAPPALKCYIDGAAPPSGRFMQPAWSPDGTELAVTESDGIHVFSNIPDLRADAPDCGQITERKLVDGSTPGWGPADVPSGEAPSTGTPAPPVTGVASPAAPAPTVSPLRELTIARRQKGHAVRARLRVQTAGSTVRVRLLSHRRPLGELTKRNVHAGALTLRVALNRRGRTALRRQGRLALQVQVDVTAPDGTASSARKAVALWR